MANNVKIKGADKLIRKLNKMKGEAAIAASAALFQEGEKIMADSKDNFTPVDTGTLKNSGFVKKPKISGKSIIVELGFGGAAKEYALIVHERLGLNHPTGGAKYLERPLLNAANGLGKRLATKLSVFVKRQGL